MSTTRNITNLDVLIIGAGAAGARTAIALAESNEDVDQLVIGKRGHGDAHTTWARGGINAALGSLDPEDDWTVHAADTLDEGHSINNPDAVELVTKNMPDRIRELEDWGMEFSRTNEGEINQRYFGAQSFRRTCFAGDHTGESLLDTLVDKAQEMEIPYEDYVMVTKILSDGDTAHGALAFDMETGEWELYRADHVVLAAGGYTSAYARHSSRDDENNGDGVGLALDAGAEVADMEFVQFHPTGMVGDRYGEKWEGRLVTEAVRGEGGRLYNVEGERFMEYYSPQQMELDARDVVARAIEQEVREGRGTDNDGVYLDVSHRDKEFIKERLPRMYERFESLGVDIAEEPMEVAPTTHYAMGGVRIDWGTGETGVSNLYAVGETTVGVHGANRLGGNSLAETVAMGKEVGDEIASSLTNGDTMQSDADVGKALPADVVRDVEHHLEALDTAESGLDPRAMMENVRDVMHDHANIRRDGDALRDGLSRIEELRERGIRVPADRSSRDFEMVHNARFMLVVAETVLRGALERDESRGAHYRVDAPEKHEEWRRTIVFARDGDVWKQWTEAVGEPSDAVQEAVEEGYYLDYHLLE